MPLEADLYGRTSGFPGDAHYFEGRRSKINESVLLTAGNIEPTARYGAQRVAKAHCQVRAGHRKTQKRIRGLAMLEGAAG
jgi:hypothetical protein